MYVLGLKSMKNLTRIMYRSWIYMIWNTKVIQGYKSQLNNFTIIDVEYIWFGNVWLSNRFLINTNKYRNEDSKLALKKKRNKIKNVSKSQFFYKSSWQTVKIMWTINWNPFKREINVWYLSYSRVSVFTVAQFLGQAHKFL